MGSEEQVLSSPLNPPMELLGLVPPGRLVWKDVPKRETAILLQSCARYSDGRPAQLRQGRLGLGCQSQGVASHGPPSTFEALRSNFRLFPVGTKGRERGICDANECAVSSDMCTTHLIKAGATFRPMYEDSRRRPAVAGCHIAYGLVHHCLFARQSQRLKYVGGDTILSPSADIYHKEDILIKQVLQAAILSLASSFFSAPLNDKHASPLNFALVSAQGQEEKDGATLGAEQDWQIVPGVGVGGGGR